MFEHYENTSYKTTDTDTKEIKQENKRASLIQQTIITAVWFCLWDPDNLPCPATGASSVSMLQTFSDQLPLPEPCHRKQHCFSLLEHCLVTGLWCWKRETGLSPSPKSIFATITQKQEEMAYWRVVVELTMQYNGYLAMQKQTHGHEHMLNMSIYTYAQHGHRHG